MLKIKNLHSSSSISSIKVISEEDAAKINGGGAGGSVSYSNIPRPIGATTSYSNNTSTSSFSSGSESDLDLDF